MQRATTLGLGVMFLILGLFLFGIAYSNYQSCLNAYRNPSYCNSQVPWGLPTEVGGGLITAIGAGLVVISIVAAMGKKQPTTSS